MSISSAPHLSLRLIPWIALVVTASSSLYYIHQLHAAHEQERLRRQQLESHQRALEAELSHTHEQLTQMRCKHKQIESSLAELFAQYNESNALLAAAEQRIDELAARNEQLRDERNVYKSSLKRLERQTKPNAQKSTLDVEAQSDELYDPSIFGLPDSH